MFFFCKFFGKGPCVYLRTADNGGYKEVENMKLWRFENEQDEPCEVTYVYQLVLLPDGTVRLPSFIFEPDLWAQD